MVPLVKKDGKMSTRNENDDQFAFIITNDSLA